LPNFANVPLEPIGGGFALLATGIPSSVSSAIGFIALFGQAGSLTVIHEDLFTVS